MPASIRLRDFIEDRDGWLYAVSTYDNEEKVGCVLRYAPDTAGERVDSHGRRYHKFDFEEGFDWIRQYKPGYLDVILRVPQADVKRVYKPEQEIDAIATRDWRINRLVQTLNLSPGTLGVTGSILVGLANEKSDIDLVAYGSAFFLGQERLRKAIERGAVSALSEQMWRTVYKKREPEIPFDVFVAHERRKWNRGVLGDTYFDLLYTRSYSELSSAPTGKGAVLGRKTITATVTDASLSFDYPAVYRVNHPEISRVLSFTHTYSGQAQAGEVIEACGVCERHGDELWLVVGTTRTARGEYILSRTLLERLEEVS